MKIFYYLLLLSVFLIPFETTSGQEIIREEPEPKTEAVFQNHHISFTIGYGFRTAKTADGIDREMARHIDGLKGGFVIHGNYAYFPGGNIGPSVKYTQFFASNTTMSLNSRVNILFLGGGVSTRTFASSNTLLNAGFHLGYVGYRELDSVSGVSVELSGKTVGVDGAVSLNILISKSASLQFEAGYQLAAISKVRDASGQTYELEEPESLNRIDLNTGIKIHF